MKFISIALLLLSLSVSAEAVSRHLRRLHSTQSTQCPSGYELTGSNYCKMSESECEKEGAKSNPYCMLYADRGSTTKTKDGLTLEDCPKCIDTFQVKGKCPSSHPVYIGTKKSNGKTEITCKMSNCHPLGKDCIIANTPKPITEEMMYSGIKFILEGCDTCDWTKTHHFEN